MILYSWMSKIKIKAVLRGFAFKRCGAGCKIYFHIGLCLTLLFRNHSTPRTHTPLSIFWRNDSLIEIASQWQPLLSYPSVWCLEIEAWETAVSDGEFGLEFLVIHTTIAPRHQPDSQKCENLWEWPAPQSTEFEFELGCSSACESAHQFKIRMKGPEAPVTRNVEQINSYAILPFIISLLNDLFSF